MYKNNVSFQGWEDITDININHLLSTILSKNVSEKQKNSSCSLEKVFEISKLKKHIAWVIDCLITGGDQMEITNYSTDGKLVNNMCNNTHTHTCTRL